MTTRSANHYVLSGTIDGVVDTSGLGGAPTVDVRFEGNSLRDAELHLGDGGIEVTAVVDQIPDRRSVRLKLILPRVNVADDVVVFAGVALVVTESTTIGGPDLVQGPVHSYDVRPLAGTADAVEP